jgi:tetratricopeptide (TPR) repeat protein
MFKAPRQTCSPLEFLADRLTPKPGLETRVQRSRSMLLRALAQGTTIAFIGSGVSRPFKYPAWNELVLDVFACTLAELRKVHPIDPSVQPCVQYIESLQKVARGGSLLPDGLMFMVGACKEALSLHGRGEAYERLFREKFRDARCPSCDNVFEALLELPIHRFVTTNYDCEIERALDRIRRDPAALKGLDLDGKQPATADPGGGLSFTQRIENLERLTLFAMARAQGTKHMVFHCHGRFDEPQSIVATEGDYKKWYLGRDDVASTSFQQSVELLLGSNPLLFIGYGLRDEDLLRPLRQLSVIDPARRYVRPIFALFASSREHPENDLYQREALCERYGVHVIPYDPIKGDDGTRALRGALVDLREDLEEARQKWSKKPLLKSPGRLIDPSRAYCEIARPVPVPVKPIAGLEKEVCRPGLVVLIGPSGSGKSLHAIELMKSGGFEGRFYWNAHYGNEAVTAIDYALAYFDPDRKYGGSRHDRICKCLREKRYLLVLDGCERLLQRGENPRVGTTYSVTFRRLLKAFAHPKNRSTVVLATRLWPAELDLLRQERDDDSPIIRRLPVSRPEAEDVEACEPFASLLKEAGSQGKQRAKREISALCSLLRGHSYGLYLAGKYIEGPKRWEDRLGALEDLNQKLAARHRDERLQRMVHLQVLHVERKHGEGSASALLERVSNFLGPVCDETLAICCRDARLGQGDIRTSLIDSGLLLPMRRLIAGKKNPDKEPQTYVLHSTARGAVLSTRHSAPADPLPAFGLSGCTCGRVGVDPERTRKRQIQSLFDHVIAQAEAHLAKGEREMAGSLCRDAFTLVRTRMQANTAPRWCAYEEYLQFPLSVAVLAKKVAPGCWTYCEHADGYDLAQSSDAPLFPAELAWLYNDIALALSAGGGVHNACTLWEQAYEVCRLIEDHESGGGFHLEVLLSLAFTFIEMGKLPAGSRQLDDAERLLCRLEDDDYAARILGLRGLMRHLQGDLQEADELYDRCLKLLRPGVNLRAQSIFLKHKADIKISTQEFEEADLLIRNSRAFAESGVFPDLVANARISEGHRLTRMGQAVKARLEYTAVLREAQQIGLRKLEVRALTALARLALDQKDPDNGRDLAMKALSLANELGLGLRQSHALVVLGLATLELGQSSLGIAYLKQAKRLADSQEYWSRSREAENKLMELGVKPVSSD